MGRAVPRHAPSARMKCPVCLAEPATVDYTGPTRKMRVGQKCSRLVEIVMLLLGADDAVRRRRTRPTLRAVK
jgi:hypothetical protein